MRKGRRREELAVFARRRDPSRQLLKRERRGRVGLGRKKFGLGRGRKFPSLGSFVRPARVGGGCLCGERKPTTTTIDEDRDRDRLLYLAVD